ncbi:hypothetical protein QVD17_05816 [Tagetes erecta]|uniref:BHLH domain-containing protein n=1 Tax=Tagetes erecta TaxID=13708 RepID=A0AAD8LJE3_TARER|nr:hypothetical protein QVD17_05816 [Tagetes erecta]
MEISEFRGFSEFSGIMEDPCFNSQWPFTTFDPIINMETSAVAFDNYPPMFDHYKPVLESSTRPCKQLKTSSWNSCITSDHSIMNQTLHNYANQVLPKEETGTVSSHVQLGNHNHNHHAKKMVTNNNTARLNTPQDHILAERKRRERLSQRFIALSALVPGLKKMDKASVLGDAIKYLKTLQEKVKTLEEQTKNKSNVESVVFVKKYEVLADGGAISSPDVDPKLPEVEARFSGKDVLIRIHCEKKAGLVEKTLAEIEKLHLSVINTSAMSFASYALDITVVAQMNKEFSMTMKDLVNNLSTRLKRFM